MFRPLALTALEIEPQSKLHDTWVVDGLVHLTEVGAVDVLHVDAISRQTQLGVIEQVEHLCAELETDALVKDEVLKSREISVHEIRARNWGTRGGSQLSG